MEPDVLGFEQVNFESMHELFRKQAFSLEELILNSGMDPLSDINKKRLAFEFPNEFSFKDSEFKKEILYLFNRDEFSTKSKSDKLKKKAIRNIYQTKCKNYLVNKFNWPESLTNNITKALSLPAYIDKDFNYYINHKKELSKDALKIITRGIYQGSEIISASIFIGNYPERFAKPTAKFLNIKRKTMTRLNIIYDISMLVIESGALYGMTREVVEHGLFDNENIAVDAVKMLGYSYFLVHTLIRAIQVPVRIVYSEFKDKHIPSYATATSPNIGMLIITAPPIIYDHVLTLKENKLKEKA
ncbi:MAG: hypothetical protein WC758_03500 [Candidatus Woesearchaeota archaeon]|jgi:hypothetical protein